LATKAVSENVTANDQRKVVPNSWSGYSKTTRTKTRADVGSKQQFRIAGTQSMRRSISKAFFISVC